MKEENGSQDVGSTAFDYPNNVAPRDYNKIHYGNQHVPHPTNSAAKVVQHDKVMKQVLEGK